MKGIKKEWNNSKHAWCISNGIRTIWCSDKEYNETIRELEEEISSLEL